MKKLAVLFVALNVVDICLTLYFVGNGTSTELNPLIAKVLTLPLPLILAYKIIVPIILVTALIASGRLQLVKQRMNIKLVLVLLVVIETSICSFNSTGLICS